ncbi:MAG: dihydropteroate synthase [Nitrososphaerota archaeon]|nr:dihydropteroate synthase [Nitrososphaerota archaeon]MDG6939893.1 dihydropteroate synthase [Nitrososphaerota archaeon]
MALSNLGSVRVGDGEPVRVIGVINLSPESFYGGSVVKGPEEAVEAARAMVEQGAAVIDLGGMSTAPYKSTMVSEEVEAGRLLPAVRAVKKELSVDLSVDTYRSGVAESCLSAGAGVVNDVTGLRGDPRMAGVIADHGASAILMTSSVRPGGQDPLARIRASLDESVSAARDAGVPGEKVVVDPGIGFFRDQEMKWLDWDTYVITNLRRLALMGLPVNVGVSRKSFIGSICGVKDPAGRLYGSLAAEAVCVANGAHSVRTHNVAATVQAVKLAQRVRREPSTTAAGGMTGTALDQGLMEEDVAYLLRGLGVHAPGVAVLARKGAFRVFMLRRIPKVLALVAKQEMLSLGGEVATPKETILGGEGDVDVLVMGTLSHVRRLAGRLEAMSFGFLKERDAPDLAALLRELLR